MFFRPVGRGLDQFDIPTNQLAPTTIPSPIVESIMKEKSILFKFLNSNILKVKVSPLKYKRNYIALDFIGGK